MGSIEIFVANQGNRTEYNVVCTLLIEQYARRHCRRSRLMSTQHVVVDVPMIRVTDITRRSIRTSRSGREDNAVFCQFFPIAFLRIWS